MARTLWGEPERYKQQYWERIPGVYLAGDASKEVQLAIVAAAEGVRAAFAIHKSLASEESVTLELFRNALALARHRDLHASDDPTLARRREVFAGELRAAVTATAAIPEMDRASAQVS